MKFEPIGKYVSLSQGMVVNKGTAHLFSDIKDDKHSHPLLRIVDFESGNHANYSKYVSNEVPAKVIIDETAILFTRVTCQCFRGFRGVFHNNLFRVELTSNELIDDYLYVVLQSDYVKKQALRFVSSSVVPDLTHDLFKSIIIPIPDIEEQKKIAKVILDINRKISLNEALCSELDEMLDSVYKYWFLQYDYPDKYGKPYKASGGQMVWNDDLKKEIPQNWTVKKLGDLFSDQRGISYNTKAIEAPDGVPMINLASFSPDGTYKVDGIKTFSGEYSHEKVLKPYDLVICNTQQTAIDFKKDIIGKALLVPDIFDGNEIVSSHHVTTLKVYNEPLKFYLSRMFNMDYFHKFISGYTNGTNILGLLFDGVKQCKVAVPDDNTAKRFADISQKFESRKSKIIMENQELTSLRDLILPVLLNGQASIGK